MILVRVSRDYARNEKRKIRWRNVCGCFEVACVCFGRCEVVLLIRSSGWFQKAMEKSLNWSGQTHICGSRGKERRLGAKFDASNLAWGFYGRFLLFLFFFFSALKANHDKFKQSTSFPGSLLFTSQGERPWERGCIKLN